MVFLFVSLNVDSWKNPEGNVGGEKENRYLCGINFYTFGTIEAVRFHSSFFFVLMRLERPDEKKFRQ